MQTRLIENIDATYLDRLLLDDRGLPKAVRAQALLRIREDHRLAWAKQRGVYQFVTTELLDFLREIIGDRTALEICAGLGGIGRNLGIPMTDAAVHLNEMAQNLYGLLREVAIDPPDDIDRLEASDAVRKYKPQVVIGAYASQTSAYSLVMPHAPSSLYGVYDLDILANCETYVLIGNAKTHADRLAFYLRPKWIYEPWLITRSFDQTQNRIWVWDNRKA